MIRLLELFKGTGSVCKVFKEMYPDAEVISLDINCKCNPTHCCDIMDFNYKMYPKGHFDVIWASPECKVFSQLQTSNIGRKWKSRDELDAARREHAQFVERTVEIIMYFNPWFYFIENPYTSAMKDIPVMKTLPSYRFDYCQFGYDYMKPTRIWTNRNDLQSVTCSCKGIHQAQIGAGRNVHSINQKYSIPPLLVEHLLTF